MALLPGKDKFTRIQELIDWGFNAPVYTIIKKWQFEYAGRVNQPSQFIYDICNINNWKRVSIRVNKPIGGAKVAFINKNPQILYKLNYILAEELFDNNHDLIITSGLPPSDVFSGCIEVLLDRSFILEVVSGGPVRDLTHGKRSPCIRIVSNLESDLWRFHPEFGLVQALSVVSNLGPTGHIMYEFSIFRFKVGCKKENIIFWEYERLSDGYKKCDERICNPSVWGNFSQNLFKAEGTS